MEDRGNGKAAALAVRQGRRRHRRWPGDRQGARARARERGLPRGDRRRGRRLGRGGRRRARRPRAGPRGRRHRPAGLLGLPRCRRGADRADRRARQQRGHHAGGAVRRGGRRDGDPPDRDQPPRRDPRHEGGHAADEAARHRPHRQRGLQRGQDGLPAPRDLLRDEARRRRDVRGRARRAARRPAWRSPS